jgi:hypothetical protein
LRSRLIRSAENENSLVGDECIEEDDDGRGQRAIRVEVRVLRTLCTREIGECRYERNEGILCSRKETEPSQH